MCGIAGTYRSNEDVAAMLDRIRHRGPDGRGIETSGDAVHGHVRLSLLDLSAASAQPFKYRDNLLTFNGEIWNYRELKAELESLGHSFQTTGDTEVLAAALDQWGTAALGRLDGMFAFAWSRGATHVLVTDQYGKVPLYVKRTRAGFSWASERKAWEVRSGVDQVPPGAVLDVTTGQVRRWYTLPAGSRRPPEDVLPMLRGGVEKRLHADAPVCCLISGGLDSSVILQLAVESGKRVTAYTAFHDEKSADLKYAQELCTRLGVPLHAVYVPRPTETDIETAAWTIEIPSKAQLEIALLCVPLAKKIAADGFKACLSGESADELFGGYGNMCIQGAKATDAEWREIRVNQLEKMARGNFVRCNKVFMGAGVECRLPFMEQALVESVLNYSRRECPPGKGLLKKAAYDYIPPAIIKRPKGTFQGESGIADACGLLSASPVKWYNSIIRTMFGEGVRG